MDLDKAFDKLITDYNKLKYLADIILKRNENENS